MWTNKTKKERMIQDDRESDIIGELQRDQIKE